MPPEKVAGMSSMRAGSISTRCSQSSSARMRCARSGFGVPLASRASDTLPDAVRQGSSALL